MDHHPSQKSAHRSRASLIVLITLAFLLMTATVVLLASLPEDAAWQTETTSTTGSTPENSGFVCEASEAQQFHPFGSGVIKLTASRVVMLDIHGAEIYSADVDFAAPFCVSSDGSFLTADRDGHSLAMFNAEGEAWRATVDGRISGAAVGPDGLAAVVQDRSDSTGVVTIFSESGTRLFDCVFAESGYALSVSFPDTGDFFDVALVNTAGAAARPVVKRYSLEGKQIGQREPGLTAIYPLIAYGSDEHLILCGSADLAAITYDSDSILWQKQYHQIAAARSTDLGLAVLAAGSQDGQFSLDLLGSDGAASTSQLIGDSITNLDIFGKLAAMGCGTRVIVADLAAGQAALDQDVAAEVIRVGFADDHFLTVVTRNGVLRLAVPD